MTTIKYYIEDLDLGVALLNNGHWEQYGDDNDHMSFTSHADALAHIDTLSNGEYRIFSRITKS